MSEELKACPFCGSEAKHQYSEIDHMNIYRCSSSKCITRKFDWYLRDDWNTRPLEDALRKQLEDALLLIYAMDYKQAPSLAVAEVCDTFLDKSGALLGRIRQRFYARNGEIERIGGKHE